MNAIIRHSGSSDIPALGLDRLVLSIGTPGFLPALRDSLHNVARVDQCMVFAFRSNDKPLALLSLGSMDRKYAHHLGSAYVDEYHSADPNRPIIFRDDRKGTPLLMRFAAERKYRRDYMKKFFKDSGICDKFAVAYWQEGFCIYSNFYRLNPSGRLESDDLGRLTVVAPLVAAAIARHFSAQQESRIYHDDTSVIGAFFSENPPFSALTEREREVCAGILIGRTSEAISCDLEIGINSVLTYRKRAYSKLGIGSANELFAMFIRHGGPRYLPQAGSITRAN